MALLFKKRISAKEFAQILHVASAHLFSPEALEDLLGKAGVAIEENKRAAALQEWMIFGLYAFKNPVTNECGEDAELRDAIIYHLLGALYAALEDAGMNASELPTFEAEIRKRFKQYDKALSCTGGEGPVWHLASEVAPNIAGRQKDLKVIAFGMGAVQYSTSAGKVFKALLKDYKVTREAQ